MMNLVRPALLLLWAATVAQAGDLQVKDAWVRGTVPAQRATGAFMQITSPAGATLTGASSPLADSVELHEMSLDNGVMHMRPITRLALPAGQSVELKPGGYHLMLQGLKQALGAGANVPLTLRFEQGGKPENLDLQIPVRSLTTPAGGMHGQMHGEAK